MFNLETINLFTSLRAKKKQEDIEAKERARSELKKYECFNTLLNQKEECFAKCKDTILQEILTTTRANSRINRDYLIGYQDALDTFMRNFNRYKLAVEKLS